MAEVSYITGAQLPDLTVLWKDENDAIINFSAGWTFEARVGQAGAPALFTKTTGITGAATDPNVTIAWATTGELNNLPVGASYQILLTATRGADSKKRRMVIGLYIQDAVEA